MRIFCLALLAFLVAGCPEKCVSEALCMCANGNTGTLSCDASGAAGACKCLNTDGGTGGGSQGGGTGGSGGGGAMGGGGGGGGSVDAGPFVTLTEFCANITRVLCEQRIACGQYDDAGFTLCTEREARQVSDLCRRATAGSVQFDGFAAAQCLAPNPVTPGSCIFGACPQLRGRGLSPFGNEGIFSQAPNQCGASTCTTGTACDERCHGPQCLPLRQRGQSCGTSSSEFNRVCVSGTECASLDGGPPLCLDFAPTGGDCSRLSCAPSDSCDSNGPNSTCVAKLLREASCTQPFVCLEGVCRSDGHCGALDAGAACVSGRDCGGYAQNSNVCLRLSLSADGGLLDAGVCGPRPAIGEPCARNWAQSFDACRSSLGEACLDGVCSLQTPASRPAGAECARRPYGYVAAPLFGFGACRAGLTCLAAATPTIATGRCQPMLQSGSLCTDEAQCTPGLGCVSVDGGPQTCQHRGVLGAACQQSTCLSELNCEQASDGGPTCVPLAAPGESCSGYASCVDQAQCTANVCEALAPTGGSCLSGAECVSSNCQLGACVDQCE